MSKDEIEYVRRTLGREPNDVEWGMLDIMFSEHCSYKSSRPVLKLLPTRGSQVIVGPGYDSGIVDIGGGYAAAFKIESHNHPSAIEPYNGAATGVGGIIRDVLCVGARPVGLLDSLRFGPLNDGHTRWLFKNVVKGIAGYGNCTGIPTVGGEIEFDVHFRANCLVNVACVGIARKRHIVLARLRNPGDVLVLAGGSTGRDGIHGVTFASKTLTDKSESDRPAVQIGDPFVKKLLIEAVLEAIATGEVVALKDLGGGGLTCASSEMAAKGGTGVDINLDQVHVREGGMTAYDIMLSESQERMLFAINPPGLQKVLTVLERYEVPFSIIGKVTHSGFVVARKEGKVVVNLPAGILAQAPVIVRSAKPPRQLEQVQKLNLPPEPADLERVLLSLLSSPNVASKQWVYEQYDHEVGIRSVVKPGSGDAAVLRVLDYDRAIAISTDCNSRYCYLDPFNGGAGALAEGVQNVTASGAIPTAYTDGCNFGNPENPEVFWQFKEAIRGLAYMSRKLRLPCVGGNVSFYNEDETSTTSIKPTIIIVTLGTLESVQYARQNAFQGSNEVVVVIGETFPELGGSEYLKTILGLECGKPPRPHPEKVRASAKFVQEAIRKNALRAVHDCSKGGILLAMTLMSLKGKTGVTVDIGKIPSAGCSRLDEVLFSESYARFVATCDTPDVQDLKRLAKKNHVAFAIVGKTTHDSEIVFRHRQRKLAKLSLQSLEAAWRDAIPKAISDAE